MRTFTAPAFPSSPQSHGKASRPSQQDVGKQQGVGEVMYRVTSLTVAALAAAIGLAGPASAKPNPQYVAISFDGALDIPQWERSRALAAETGASFTYFLSCVFALSQDTRDIYNPPAPAPARSNVGFGYSKEDVAARLHQIWTARTEGHEIASHACGHFDGAEWALTDWKHEFDQFSDILRHAWRNNGIGGEPEGWRAFVEEEIIGFRAPYLAHGPAMFEALVERGFAYDASTVSREPIEPDLEAPLVSLPLPMIPEGPQGRPVLAMDYNLYVRHSGGLERPSEAALFEERTLEAFRAAFERELSGQRRPLSLGFHFTLMNDAAYWRALERFAHEVCTRPDVACVSHAGLVKQLAGPATSAIDGQ